MLDGQSPNLHNDWRKCRARWAAEARHSTQCVTNRSCLAKCHNSRVGRGRYKVELPQLPFDAAITNGIGAVSVVAPCFAD